MSAKDTSQRSSFSCSSSWWRLMSTTCDAMMDYAAAFSARARAAADSPSAGRCDGGTKVMSFSWTTRGLSPAWIERMPSTISARSVQLLLGELLQARGDREVDDVGRGDAEQRRDERGGDRRAERLGLVEVAEHVDEAEDGADDAHRRGVAAGLVERLHGRGVALAHGVVLGLEDVGDEVGVGAVDDELQALLGVRVLDRAGDLVEREQAVAAGGLGVADELDDLAVEVRRRGVERLHVQLRDVLDGVEARAHDHGAERAAEHDQHGRTG